jgi:glycosyltransferase involved in cell wall biosynthesis
MNVACLVPYPLDWAPSQRFRVEQWARPLAARGIKVDFVPFLQPDTMRFLYKPGRVIDKSRDMLAGVARRATWAMRRAREYDVVVIHREAMLFGLDWVERYLSRQVPTVFDFDDAVWLPNVSKANRAVGFLKGFEKVNRILGMVTTVSAGCEYLADQARKFSSDVHIVPTSIELETYSPPRQHGETKILTVGWTGSVTSAVYLAQITEAMKKAAKRIPMRLSIMGTKDFSLPGVDVECQDWTAEKEVSVIRSFDVGLKPAAREEWALGKCPMKDIQYMALGVPCIATKFGTSVESIEHGRNGFLCDTDDDWVDALVRMTDVEARRRMGIEGRRVVESRYSSLVAADAFAGALESARRRFRSRRPSRSALAGAAP